jgi:LysR family glycine cleavage system transcriptional activator
MKVTRRLPSLRSLRAFAVAGRHLSFKLAAEELYLTASAVSHQVKSLEELLDIELFQRKTRALELTAPGQKYFDFLDGMFARLEAETHQLWAEYGRQIIRLCVPPFFSSEILMPRLDALQQLMPETDIRITTPPSGMKHHSSEADLSILLGKDEWPDLVTHRLFAGNLVVAAAPALLNNFDHTCFESLNGQTFIVHENRPDSWKTWSRALGISQPRAGKILRFDSMSSVMQAVAGGLGFAIVYWPLSDRWFRSGKIHRVFKTDRITDEYFYLAHRPEESGRPEIVRIVDWMTLAFTNDS